MICLHAEVNFGDTPYSFTVIGVAGVTYFYCDLLIPEKASFPALELSKYI